MSNKSLPGHGRLMGITRIQVLKVVIPEQFCMKMSLYICHVHVEATLFTIPFMQYGKLKISVTGEHLQMKKIPTLDLIKLSIEKMTLEVKTELMSSNM